MGNIIPVAEDVVEFIKRGTESEQIALENLKTIAPTIKKQVKEDKTVFLVAHQPFHSNEPERILEVCLTEKAAQHYIDTHIDEYDKQDTYIKEYAPYGEEE